MEGNAIAVRPGRPTDATHELTIWVSTQMPHGFRSQAAQLFGLEAERVRVIAPHVGGGFGGKAGVLAEHTVAIGVARAARPPGELGGDPLGEPGLDAARPRPGRLLRARASPATGAITGLRARVVGDSGAYAGFGGALAIGPTYMMSQGVYDIPKIALRRRGRAHQHHADGRVPRRRAARRPPPTWSG